MAIERKKEMRYSDVMSDALKLLGERLYRIRKSLGLTQLQIAEKAGMDVRYYSKIERGQVNVTFLTLSEISRVLGICPGQLVLPKDAFPEEMVDLCSAITNLSLKGNKSSLKIAHGILTKVLCPEAETSASYCPAISVSTRPSARDNRKNIKKH